MEQERGETTVGLWVKTERTETVRIGYKGGMQSSSRYVCQTSNNGCGC